MCFSAPVSFTASGVLAVTGAFCLHKAHTRQELPFASVPFLFAIQQFLEGLLWIIIPRQGFIPEQYWLTQAFAFFIGVVWPTLIPLGLALLEPGPRRRHSIEAIFALGVMVAVYTLSVILRFGVDAAIIDNCIVYQYPGDEWPGMLVIYVMATSVAFFFSSERNIRWIGAANIIGLFVAYCFYRLNYTSVWCFFAAIISGLIYLHFRHVRRRTEAKRAA